MIYAKYMISKILNHQSKTITKGAFIIAIFYIINGAMALLRNGLLAGKFGAERNLDIYYAAFRIPDFLYAILIAGALSAALIPLFVEKLNISKEKAWEFSSKVLSVFALILLAGAIITIIFAPFLAKLIAPGFSLTHQKMVANLTRIMMIQPILLGLSNIIVGILQSFKRFLITSLSPILYNLGIIIGIIFLYPLLGISGLAVGVVLGAVFHFAIQLPSLKGLDFKFKFLPKFKDKDIKEVFKLMIPRVAGLMSVHINFLAITIISSSLAVGSLAIFNFANDLQSLPQNIFAISFAIASFPILAGLSKDKEEFNNEIQKTIKNILFFIIPVSFLFFFLKNEIIGITLNYGRFDFGNVFLVSKALGIFSLSLIAQGLLPLLIRAFFALKNSIQPFFAGLTANLFNIILGIILSKKFGILGLVSAFAISSWLNLIILIILLYFKKGINLLKISLLKSVGRILLSSVFLGAFCLIGKNIPIWLGLDVSSWMINFISLIAGGVLGVGVYIVFLIIISAPEIYFLKKFFGK